jgi:tetratricopeptide (TPR) repeat protein
LTIKKLILFGKYVKKNIILKRRVKTIYRKIILTFIILFVIVGGFFLIINNIFSFERGVTGYEKYSLSWGVIWIYTNQAKKGNGNAAYKLGMYYQKIDKNYKKSIYWFEKGIQINNMDCLFELASFYELSINKQEHELGVRYFKQLVQEAKNGNEMAIKYLDKIPDNLER